ncbi:hypothetical protein POTOM_025965 [Populus tomentosa]|uniref:Uncharacterized protein n=1 Tax=Populus tomentosa TaxID=118781 RepID=A0A8X7ZF04_POPTO|nr:hypothetical protein POTOM_025965 [Populus tomentosa]
MHLSMDGTDSPSVSTDVVLQNHGNGKLKNSEVAHDQLHRGGRIQRYAGALLSLASPSHSLIGCKGNCLALFFSRATPVQKGHLKEKPAVFAHDDVTCSTQPGSSSKWRALQRLLDMSHGLDNLSRGKWVYGLEQSGYVFGLRAL